MKILISAAEVSSDLHAAQIVRGLLKLATEHGIKIKVFGIGGTELRSIPEFECILPAENLRAMGFTEVLGKLITLRGAGKTLLKRAEEEKPDWMITFDYPDFHFQFLKKIQKLDWAQKCFKVCGIPPKVWVWRSGRVEKIRQYYNAVWVIFPFEKNFYESKGIPVIYEGNPLIAALPHDLTPEEALKQIGVSLQKHEQMNDQLMTMPIAVMPGSRDAELKYHLPLLSKTLNLFSSRIQKKVVALVPVPLGTTEDTVRKIELEFASTEKVQVKVIRGQSGAVLRACRLGLIKSGTSTLEAAVLGCFPVIFYVPSRLSQFIFKMLIRYWGPVGLPNILLGEKTSEQAYFPEILGYHATPERLADQLFLSFQMLKTDSGVFLKNQNFLKNNLGVSEKFTIHSRQIGDVVAQSLWEKWNLISNRSKSIPIENNFFLNGYWQPIVSWVWSSVNWIMRRTYRAMGLKKKLCLGPSVLIGNLQAGGSGKTPVVIALAKLAIKQGLKVAILSRGYGRKELDRVVIWPKSEIKITTEVGDEVVEIQHSLPEAWIGVGSNRHEVAEMLEKVAGKMDLVFLDDGFQHHAMDPDFIVLCRTQLGKPIVYRDFISESNWADLQLFTKGDHPTVIWKAAVLPKLPMRLWCAVADPSEVVQFYSEMGARFDAIHALPDHAAFELESVRQWMKKAAENGCIVVVTPKDFVKLAEIGIREYDADKVSTLTKPDSDRVWVLKRSLDLNEPFFQIVARLQLPVILDKLP
jgi:lipid-A-disaccharide synthase